MKRPDTQGPGHGIDPFGGEAVNPSQRIAQAPGRRDRRRAPHRRRDPADRIWRRAGNAEITHRAASSHSCSRSARPANARRFAGTRGGELIRRAHPRQCRRAAGRRIHANNAANGIFSLCRSRPCCSACAMPTSPLAVAIAGTFVCNQVFYALMHALRRRRSRGGFVHVPYLPEQAARHAGAPSSAV